MRPLNFALIILLVMLIYALVNDANQDQADNHQHLQETYNSEFQAAVDDAGAYLGRFEAQQTTEAIRYQEDKRITFDADMLNVFYENLALKYGIEGNKGAIENLKLHMPGMVEVQYNGYVMITLDDTASAEGQSNLEPTFWPMKPYVYALKNGNLLYFTLDDQATIYDVNNNRYLQGDYTSLITQTDLSPLTTIDLFREARQSTIVSLIEKDLGGAINRHLALIKRMDLNIGFSIPKGLDQQSIQDVGFMAFIQGYPLPDGELFNGYAFGGGAVVKRKAYIGSIASTGQHIAYQEGCVPSNVEQIETLYDPEEAAKKGYYLRECFTP